MILKLDENYKKENESIYESITAVCMKKGRSSATVNKYSETLESFKKWNIDCSVNSKFLLPFPVLFDSLASQSHCPGHEKSALQKCRRFPCYFWSKPMVFDISKICMQAAFVIWNQWVYVQLLTYNIAKLII